MKRFLVLFMVSSIALVGCSQASNPETQASQSVTQSETQANESETKVTKPENVQQEIWDESIQATIAINNAIENEKEVPAEIAEIITSWGNEDNLTEEELNIQEKVAQLHIDAMILDIAILEGSVNEETFTNYEQSYQKLVEIFGESNLPANNLADSFVQTMEENASKDEKEKEEFISEANITVSADEVQYNMPNNLNKNFYLEGTLELCDYYNYGYTNEDAYFCGHLIPFDGGYSDSWHLYFHREDFDGVYQVLLEFDTVDLRVAAQVAGSVYEQRQGNMAMVTRTEGLLGNN